MLCFFEELAGDCGKHQSSSVANEVNQVFFF